jgi:hypothetical protein
MMRDGRESLRKSFDSKMLWNVSDSRRGCIWGERASSGRSAAGADEMMELAGGIENGLGFVLESFQEPR